MSTSLLKTLFKDIRSLIFPQQCIDCGSLKLRNRNIFCNFCMKDIGYTDHFQQSNNELLRRLLPRIDPEFGAALFNYVKEGKVQRAIHALKYSGRKDLGFLLGLSYGYAYLKSSHFLLADYIIPVPIHNSRLRKRQYNQSIVFGKGISKVTGIELNSSFLIKNNPLKSQTTKTRINRFDDVLNSFELANSHLLHNKRILLIDDVLTTGATIEAAYYLMKQVPGITIQVGVIALAIN